MTILKKASLFVLIASITSASLLGCSKKDDKTADVSNDVQVENEASNEDLSDKVVLTVGDVEVDYKEVLLYMQSYKEEYESLYGKDIWSYNINNEGDTFEQIFKEQLLEDITYVKIICAQAEELGISLTEDELLDVDEYTAEFLSSFSDEQLKYFDVSIDTVKKIYRDNVLSNKIFESLTLNVDTDVTDEEARQMVLQYVLVGNHTYDEDGNRIEYTEEQLEEAKKKALDLREQALAAEDFYAFAQANTEDEDEIEITVGRGDMASELEDVAFSMKKGEVSEVIESDMGYFILYCVNELDREATDAAKEELITERQEEAFNSRYIEWADNTKVVLNDEIWNSISLKGDLVK